MSPITSRYIERATAIFAVADPIKDTTVEALAGLRDEGIRVVMLTGDNRTTAEAIARQLGIDEVIESAGITLLGGDLTGIVRAGKLSQATMSNIRQNLIFAFAYNSAAMSLSSVSVIGTPSGYVRRSCDSTSR